MAIQIPQTLVTASVTPYRAATHIKVSETVRKLCGNCGYTRGYMGRRLNGCTSYIAYNFNITGKDGQVGHFSALHREGGKFTLCSRSFNSDLLFMNPGLTLEQCVSQALENVDSVA